jgi:hypothetical protein
MHSPPRLRLEPRPSWIGFALIVFACAGVAVLVGLLPLPWPSTVALAALIGITLRAGHRHCVGRDVPALAHVGIDRTITVTNRAGRSSDGIVLADSYVGALLTTIVWRANGAPWWRPAGVILVLPDTLPADDFRRLRIFLRYGFPATGSPASGADAG